MTENTEQTREALKAGLAAGVNDLIERAQTLTDETRLERRQTRVLTWIALAVTLLMAGIAVAVLISLARLNSIADQNRRNGDRIVSCTTPGGECFKRNQEQGAVLLACSNKYPTDIEAIRTCVAAALAKP